MIHTIGVNFKNRQKDYEEKVKETGKRVTTIKTTIPMQLLSIITIPSLEILIFPHYEGKIGFIDIKETISSSILQEIISNPISDLIECTPELIFTSQSLYSFEGLRKVIQIDFGISIIEFEEYKHLIEQLSFHPLLNDHSIHLIFILFHFLSHYSNEFDIITNNMSDLFNIKPKSLEKYIENHFHLFNLGNRQYFHDKEKKSIDYSFKNLAKSLGTLNQLSFTGSNDSPSSDHLCPSSIPTSSSLISSNSSFGGLYILKDDFNSNNLLLGSFIAQSGLCYALYRAFDRSRSYKIDYDRYLHGISLFLPFSFHSFALSPPSPLLCFLSSFPPSLLSPFHCPFLYLSTRSEEHTSELQSQSNLV